MESRKIVLKNLFAGQQWRCRHKRTDLWTVGEGEGGMNGESSIHVTLHKIDNHWEFTV